MLFNEMLYISVDAKHSIIKWFPYKHQCIRYPPKYLRVQPRGLFVRKSLPKLPHFSQDWAEGEV